jgi:hypothetical protein
MSRSFVRQRAAALAGLIVNTTPIRHRGSQQEKQNMTTKELAICSALTLLSLVGALTLLAVSFNIIGFDEPIAVAVHYARNR